MPYHIQYKYMPYTNITAKRSQCDRILQFRRRWHMIIIIIWFYTFIISFTSSCVYIMQKIRVQKSAIDVLVTRRTYNGKHFAYVQGIFECRISVVLKKNHHSIPYSLLIYLAKIHIPRNQTPRSETPTESPTFYKKHPRRI